MAPKLTAEMTLLNEHRLAGDADQTARGLVHSRPRKIEVDLHGALARLNSVKLVGPLFAGPSGSPVAGTASNTSSPSTSSSPPPWPPPPSLPARDGGYPLEVLILIEAQTKGSVQTARYVWEGGKPFYGTMVGP